MFVYNPLDMRKFIFVLVLFLGGTLVFLSFGELESIRDTLRHGNVWFLLLAVLIQFVWFYDNGLLYRSLYHVLGMHDSARRLTLLSVASTFVNIVAPTAGVGGMAFFVSHGASDERPAGKVTVSTMLALLLDYIAFLVVLTLGLIELFRRNDLDPPELAASGVIFAIAGGFGFLLYLGARSADALGDALAWMARLVNRVARPFLRRDYLREERAHEFAHEMADDLKSLPEKSRSLLIPLLYALASKTLLMGVLWAAFMAFDVSSSPGTIIGSFAISYLFLIVSPTPAGVGIVEGVMPLALSSLGVPWSQAVVITLAYRGITFWLMLAVGAIAFRILQKEDD